MEKIDLSVYTGNGLKAMIKDLEIPKMSSASRSKAEEVLSQTDLSGLDLETYEKKQVTEEVPKPKKVVKVPNSSRRSANAKRWRR